MVESELETLKANNESLKLQIKSIEEENKILKEKLARYEPIAKPVTKVLEEVTADSTSSTATQDAEDSAE